MKLNKTELNAIAYRIRDNIVAAAKLDQDRLDQISDTKNLPVATAIYDELAGLSVLSKEMLAGSIHYSNANLFNNKMTVEHILKRMRVDKTTIGKGISSCSSNSDILNDLIIAQIDTENLDDLLKQVTAKHT